MGQEYAKIFKVYDNPRQIDIWGLPLADVIGALSFLIILLALYASLRAARETARANMLNSLPLLTLSFDFKNDEVIVENSGSGVAVNIKVDNFYNWWADKDFKHYGLTKVLFKKIPILKHGKTAVLKADVKGVRDLMGMTKFVMFSTNQKRPLTFAVKFSDLGGKRYITKVRISKGDVEIVSTPKPLNLIIWIGLVFTRGREVITMAWYFLKVRNRKYQDERVAKEDIKKRD
jgi:hypothetical protein